ncbi:MAG: PQQ-dependent sugar dehydrogenase, partial [Candidatus Thiodiazotropha sp.]
MQTISLRIARVASIFAVGVMAGCGGGGDGGGGTTPAVLLVDAGATRTLSLPDTLSAAPDVLIDGQPAADRVSYSWSQVLGPASVAFSDSSVATPEITFPANGSYELLLEVSDQSQTASDRLLVTVHTRASGSPGLSGPPANTTQCVAPDDAAIASSIRLTTPYPSLPNLGALVGLYQAPGDNATWYALKQTGQVVSFANNPAVDSVSTYIDISGRVDYGGEKGLLGMAFHPDFADNGFVYLSYTASPGGNLESRISRFSFDGASQTLDPASEQILLTLA